jgi:DNA-binding transcriptional LysR family regulator
VPDLNTKSLRAFVAAATLGSVARAAELLGRSDSAVSLQITALERDLGQPLFARTGRGLRLTGFGVTFLTHAEEILARIDAARREAGVTRDAGALRVGVVQDLLPFALPIVLDTARAAALAPGVTMSTGTSADLAVALGEGRIDVAVLARRHVEPDTVLTLPMIWLAAPNVAAPDPLPLVAVSPPCPFLDAATRSLSLAGRREYLRFVSPSLEAVRLAAREGLGILCRTVLASENGLQDVTERLGLPALPSISYVVETERDAGPIARTTADALKADLSQHAGHQNRLEPPPAPCLSPAGH